MALPCEPPPHASHALRPTRAHACTIPCTHTCSLTHTHIRVHACAHNLHSHSHMHAHAMFICKLTCVRTSPHTHIRARTQTTALRKHHGVDQLPLDRSSGRGYNRPLPQPSSWGTHAAGSAPWGSDGSSVSRVLSGSCHWSRDLLRKLDNHPMSPMGTEKPGTPI